jgi:hypothetical protein
MAVAMRLADVKQPVPARTIQNASPACRHRWVIDTPEGRATSLGVCRRCGASRRFPNAFDDTIKREEG